MLTLYLIITLTNEIVNINHHLFYYIFVYIYFLLFYLTYKYLFKDIYKMIFFNIKGFFNTYVL